MNLPYLVCGYCITYILSCLLLWVEDFYFYFQVNCASSHFGKIFINSYHLNIVIFWVLPFYIVSPWSTLVAWLILVELPVLYWRDMWRVIVPDFSGNAWSFHFIWFLVLSCCILPVFYLGMPLVSLISPNLG